MKSILVANYSVEGFENGTIGDCSKYIRQQSILGLDIETTSKFPKGKYASTVYKGGLCPYLSNIVLLQIGTLEKTYLIDVRCYTKSRLRPILSYLNYNENLLIVGQNLRFDAKHLKHKYGINFKHIYDTMLVEMTLTLGLPVRYGLADLSAKYLGITKKKEALLFEDSMKNVIVSTDQELIDENEHILTPFEVENNFQLDKSTRLEFVTIGKKQLSIKQLKYAADDIKFPLLIRERQMLGRKLENGNIYNPTKWQRIENTYALCLVDIELNGMYVDQKMWNDLHDKNYKIFLERQEKLNEYVVTNHGNLVAAQYDLFTEKPTNTIKWTSSKEVIGLFKQLNTCPRAYSKSTKKVEDTVGAAELLRTIPNHLKIKYERDLDAKINDTPSLVLAYLLFKKSEQAITMFGNGWLKFVHPLTGRAHSSYRQILSTTRISSANPNANNLSNGDWRDCFHVGDDQTMVNVDYSSQEVRVLAHVSKDESLLNFFNKGDDFYGDDFHAFTATKVYKILENNPNLVVPPKEIDVNKKRVTNPVFTKKDGERRTNSKQVTFGMAFGKSAYTFAQDFDISVEEANKLVDSYLDAFVGLKKHFENCERHAETRDYVLINKDLNIRWFYPEFAEIKKTYAEAQSYFPKDYNKFTPQERVDFKKKLYEEKPYVKTLWSIAGRLRGGLERKNKNFPIQGTASQMLKLAMIMFRKECIENDLDFKPIGNIYDEVLLEVDKKDGVQAGELIKKCMEDAGKFITPSVKQVADFKLGFSWGH